MTAASERAALRVLPARGEPALPAWPGAPEDVGGFRLFVRRTPVTPGAEPAVFVHGLGGASTNWTDLMYLLAPRLAGLAVDLPGFGHSEPPPRRDYSLASHTRAVTALLERLDAGPVHLVGNSLGGSVAIRIAATRPELVRTLTLVSPALPSWRPQTRADPQLLLLLLPRVSAVAARRLSRLTAEQRSREVLEMCFYDVDRLPPERLQEAVDELRRREQLGWTNEALVRSLRALVAAYVLRGPGGLWPAAARIRARTLLVWGRHDRLVSVRQGYRAARVMRDARLVVIEDGGHVSQLEHPGLVAREVLGLLDRG